MALNALRTEMVTFTGTPGFEANGVTVGYRAEYTLRTSTEAKYNAIEGRTSDVASDANHKGQYYIQLGEQLYDGKLKLYDHARDPFYRPARVWEYDGKEIGTYAKVELLREEYSAEVTGRMLYDLLGNTVLEDNRYRVDIAIDGERDKGILDDYGYFTKGNIVRGNTQGVGATGNGVLTEVYVDTENYEITIAIINTYLAVVDGDYNDKKDELDLDIYAIDDNGPTGTVAYVKNNAAGMVETETVSGEDFDVADYKDGDIVLVTVAEAEVQSISDPDVISGTEITGFKTGDWLETAGAKKDYATTALWDEAALTYYTGLGNGTNLKDTTYNVYLDQYGYVIGLEEVDPEDNYVFISGIDANASNLGVRLAEANAIFLDGTMQTIKVDVRESTAVVSNRDGTGVANAHPGDANNPTQAAAEYNAAIVNHWFSYSVGEDGVYTLKDVATQSTEDAVGGDITIDKKHITRRNNGAGYVVGNADTVYINVKSLADVTLEDTSTTGTIIDDVDTVTVGSQNVNMTVKNTMVGGNQNDTDNFAPKAEIYTLYNSDNWIIGVVTIDAEDEGVSSNYAYVNSSAVKSEYYDKTAKKWTWVREVIINGEKQDITYASDKRIGILYPGDKDGWFTGTAVADMNMDQGYWYKINYKADGTVKDIVPLAKYFIHTETTYWDDSDDEYIDHTAEIEMTYDDKDPGVAILWMKGGQNAANHTSPNKISYNEKGSVYTYVGDQTGFSISPNVKVIVANAGGKDATPFKHVSDTYTGESGLKKAINDLNANSPFVGDVSAILEGGVATSIIFNCTAPDPTYDGGQDNQTPTGEYSSVVDATAAANITGDPLNLAKAKVNDSNELILPAHAQTGIKQQLLDALNYLGYEVTDAELNAGKDTWTFTVKKDKMTEKITCKVVNSGSNIGGDAAEYVLVDVDGAKEYVVKGTTKTFAKGANDKGTGWIISTDGGTTWAYGKAYATASDAINADTMIKKGYVKVAYAAAVAGSDVTGGTQKAKVSVVSGDDYAVADKTVEVEVTVTASGATSTAPSYLTLSGTNATVTAPAEKTVSAADNDAGIVLKWTVKATADSTDITALTVTVADSPA